jgi:2-polyprenyl-6-methoxyphenol hydroxylase-like FAD-dependent oxidoreductase
MLLARRGLRVLLMDRVSFPSDTVSSHYLHHGGVACLERWNLLDTIQALGAPGIDAMRFDFGLFCLRASPATQGDHRRAYAPTRLLLDAALVEAAHDAGVELRLDCTATAVVSDHDRVTGIRYRTRRGVTGVERCHALVGADGKHTRIGQAVGARVQDSAPSRTSGSYAYWSGIEVPELSVSIGAGSVVIAFPTVSSLTCVYVAVPAEQHWRENRIAHYRDAMFAIAPLADHRASARQESSLRGSRDLGPTRRQACGQNWLLAGDARHHDDPLLAQGMSNSFLDAEVAAEAIAVGLDGGSLSRELDSYATRRWRDTAAIYELGGLLASFQPSPRVVQFLLALRDNAEATADFFGAIAGTCRPDEVLDGRNVDSIIAAAQA